MLDLTIINDLIPNILKHLSYEYHILFLKYIDSDDRIILNNHRSYIFCQLLLPNNLINIQYLLNLKQVISPKSKFNDFFHEKKLLFLLIKNNKHHIINYIYNKYPIDYKNINFKIIENPFIFEYLIKNNIIERKFLKNNYIKYVKYNIHNDDYDFYCDCTKNCRNFGKSQKRFPTFLGNRPLFLGNCPLPKGNRPDFFGNFRKIWEIVHFFGTVSGRLFYFRINRDWGSEECAHAPDRRDRWNTRAGVHCTSL